MISAFLAINGSLFRQCNYHQCSNIHTLHGYYNARSQASYKYTTTNYGTQPDHSNQQKIPIKYIINNTVLQRLTSHTEDHTSIRSWSTYENIWLEINVWKLLYTIIWKIQALTIRRIQNYMYFAISPTAWIMKISTLFMAPPRLVVTLSLFIFQKIQRKVF